MNEQLTTNNEQLTTNNEQLKWTNYQKDIANDDYYFARSCIRQNFFPAAEGLFLKIMKNVLCKNIYDDPKQTTCTGIAYHSGIIPLETTMTVVARQFALMNDSGFRNFVVSCVTSFGIYNEVLDIWKHNPGILQKIREILWKATKKEFDIPDNLVHTSDLIYKFRNEIFSQAKFSLIHKQNGYKLNIVEHVGCHYAKIFPDKGIGGAEFPKVLSGLIESWGGKVIDYPERRHCCGFGFRQYLVKANRGYSVANTKRKLDSMKNYNPDMIITNCPGCNFFLDRWQYVIAEMDGTTYGQDGFGIPVITYEELAGLILGYNPWDIGLQVHQISVDKLLDKIGISYDIQDKYKGKNGENTSIPQKPSILKT